MKKNENQFYNYFTMSIVTFDTSKNTTIFPSNNVNKISDYHSRRSLKFNYQLHAVETDFTHSLHAVETVCIQLMREVLINFTD